MATKRRTADIFFFLVRAARDDRRLSLAMDRSHLQLRFRPDDLASLSGPGVHFFLARIYPPSADRASFASVVVLPVKMASEAIASVMACSAL